MKLQVIAAEPENLKQEVQRIADNFAVNLPREWQLEIHIVDTLPGQGINYDSLPFELDIETTPVFVPEVHVVKTSAILKVINGQAETTVLTS